MARQRKRLVIYPYNPFWKSLFADEEQLLREHLKGEYKSIIHIGSTSIEGMQAKPIDLSFRIFITIQGKSVAEKGEEVERSERYLSEFC